MEYWHSCITARYYGELQKFFKISFIILVYLYINNVI